MADPPKFGLFPAIEPYDSGLLSVGSGHQMYFEQCGAPNGLPVLFVHGGPASGCSPRHRQFFDPARYRIVLFDQRGSGRSTPAGQREHNGTPELLGDIATLRRHLDIDRWLVFGGSWGASLALAAAASAPETVAGLILRGVFLTGRADMQWFFQDVGALVPDAWHELVSEVNQQAVEAGNGMQILAAFTEALNDPVRAARACSTWIAWENTLTRPGGAPQKPTAGANAGEAAIVKYRLQAAYLNRLCDLGEPALLDAGKKLSGLPTAIVHGRLDWVCRAGNAWKIHRLMADSRLRLIDHAGHDPFNADMVHALIDATNCFVRDQHFKALDASWTTA